MFSARQVAELARRGISEADAVAAGVVSVGESDTLPPECPGYWTQANGYLPGLLFPWVSVGGQVEYQIRPDEPPVDGGGRPIKYATRSRESGYQPMLWAAREGDPGQTILLTEGTCQTLAASLYAPEGMWVLGMLGCRGWMSDGAPIVDLSLVAGAAVVVALDADLWSNVDVWDAGSLLQRALRLEGASSVKFLQLAAAKKTGLDDVLGQRGQDLRGPYLASIIEQAVKEAFPASRRPKPPREIRDDDPARFFAQQEGLLVEDLTCAIRERAPALLTAEQRVALYHGGVYRVDGTAFLGAVAALLGNRNRPGNRAAAEEHMVGLLYNEDQFLPDRTPEFLINFRNGMLDPMTGELTEHDPDYLSTVQFNLDWDPTALCPNYVKWLTDAVGSQIEDLEEVSATMLDPTRTPAKAMFLYGPSKSGKSTYLRLLETIAGGENVSAIPLGTLASDRFAAANIFGKVLNSAADLSSAHVEDLSTFKMMTGDDPITGNRKFGKQFVFRNRALFAFSANEPPSVGENSRAYSTRIKPFNFPTSFAGHEDPAIEEAMRAELPGIVVRWVAALRALRARRTYLPTDERVGREFEQRSDRVRLWVAEVCEIADVLPGSEVPARHFSTASELAAGFKVWAEAQQGHGMGRNKLIDRLSSIDGVVQVRGPGGKRGFNIHIRAETYWIPGTFGSFEDTVKQPVVQRKSDESGWAIFDFPVSPASRSKVPGVPGDLPDHAESPLAAMLALIPVDGQPHCLACDSPRRQIPPVFWICPTCHPDSHDR